MKANRTVRNILILILLVANIGSDQVFKSIIRQKVDYYEKISVIDGFITLTKVENTGAFLSLGDSLPPMVYKLLMIILPLLVIGYALYYLFKNHQLSKMLCLGISFAIGGGIGNIIDRILYSSVTDFLHFDFILFQTGIVNMADISITIGFFLLIYEQIVNRKELKLKY